MTASDGDRLEQLWRDHDRAVLRYVQRRVAPADVEDVVTETFTIAWRRAAEVPDPALPWLLGVARRVAANTTRARRRREALAEKVADAYAQSPAPPAGAELVTEALQRLSDTDQELLTLIAWDGLSHEDAAAALGCTQAALRVRLHRARARLRRLLAAPQPRPAPTSTATSTPIPTVTTPHRPAQEGKR